MVNAHMRRSLGTLTTWEVYKKATELHDDPLVTVPSMASHVVPPAAVQSQPHVQSHADPHGEAHAQTRHPDVTEQIKGLKLN